MTGGYFLVDDKKLKGKSISNKLFKMK